MKNKNLYKEILIILIISTSLSLIRYMFIYDSYEFIKKVQEKSNCIINLDDIYLASEPSCVDFELVKLLFEDDLALFIDARYQDSFNEAHIEGAINISFEEHANILDVDYIKESLIYDEIECYETFCIGSTNSIPFISSNKIAVEDKLLKYNSYVIYCDGPGCPYSEDLSTFLYDNFNLKNILIYEEGFPEWVKQGLPVK